MQMEMEMEMEMEKHEHEHEHELQLLLPAAAAGAAAAFVLSRLPHSGTAPAFVDAATGTGLSFSALRRAALSLASALRLGLGLRRGDAVLVLSRNSLLLPQVLLGVLAAGAVVAAVHPDATPAEVAAAARHSGAVMLVAAPEVAARLAPLGLPPLLLTSRSPEDPAALSAEELIDGGDPAAAEVGVGVAVSGTGTDVAFLAYPSASATPATAAAVVTMTHADLVAAAAASVVGGRRVCLASLPMCSAHGLPLLALGLPAAGATTVLLQSGSGSDPRAAREAVAAHAATDFVATPEAAAAALAAPVPLDGKLSSLRRVIVAPTPLTPGAREEFRRRLPWVQLLSGTPENQTEELLLLSRPPPTGAAVIQQNSLPADPMSAATNDAASLVPPPKKINKSISGGIFSRSTMSKILRKHPGTGNRQAASKL